MSRLWGNVDDATGYGPVEWPHDEAACLTCRDYAEVMTPSLGRTASGSRYEKWWDNSETLEVVQAFPNRFRAIMEHHRLLERSRPRRGVHPRDPREARAKTPEHEVARSVSPSPGPARSAQAASQRVAASSIARIQPEDVAALLESLGLTKGEAAVKLGVSVSRINEIIGTAHPGAWLPAARWSDVQEALRGRSKAASGRLRPSQDATKTEGERD